MLTLGLKNTTTEKVTIPNPFLDDPKKAFWTVMRGLQTKEGYGAYGVVLPKSNSAAEPAEITLAPGQVYEEQVDLQGATMILDTMISSLLGPQRVLIEKLGAPGEYVLQIGAYLKTQDGVEHYLPMKMLRCKIALKTDQSDPAP